MRFTWMEGACILAIGTAALTQAGDRGARFSTPHAVAPRASIVADLRPTQRQEDVNERTSALAGR
jgi:hypothetical protein